MNIPHYHLYISLSYRHTPFAPQKEKVARWIPYPKIFDSIYILNPFCKFRIYSFKLDSNSYPKFCCVYLSFTCSIAVASTMSKGFSASTIQITRHFALIEILAIIMAYTFVHFLSASQCRDSFHFK